MTEDRLMLVVTLTVNAGETAAFEEYENAAAVAMRRHGGRMEFAVRLADPPGGENVREVHIVSFPDRAAFERYRADPILGALAPLRRRAVAGTVVEAGREMRYPGLS